MCVTFDALEMRELYGELAIAHLFPFLSWLLLLYVCIGTAAISTPNIDIDVIDIYGVTDATWYCGRHIYTDDMSGIWGDNKARIGVLEGVENVDKCVENGTDRLLNERVRHCANNMIEYIPCTCSTVGHVQARARSDLLSLNKKFYQFYFISQICA